MPAAKQPRQSKGKATSPDGKFVVVETRDALDRKCYAFAHNGELMTDCGKVLKILDKDLAETIRRALAEQRN